MIFSKFFAVVMTASTLWVLDAGKCKPHPKPTSFLTLTSGDSPATSSPVSYFTSSGDDANVFSSTDPLGSSRLTETVSSDISESSAMPSYQIPTSSPTASNSTAASVSIGSSDNVVSKAPTFSSSFTTVLLIDITTLGDSSTTTDTITTSINELSSTDIVTSSTDVSSSTGIPSSIGVSTSTEVSARISTHSTTSFETTISAEQTTTTDTTTYKTIPSQSTPTELSDTTETTVTTYITALTDVTTTASTTVYTSEITTTTENFWTSTTVPSCPVYSISLSDPSFEGDNTGPDRWDYMLQFAGVAMPFQKEDSMSKKVPRAHTENQFALLSIGPGSTLGSNMWRPMSLNPTKKYQVWFTFAAVSDPNKY
ncbi:hypothetical protein LB507_002638 [Fusarium sp. FIESC RH6]|nr:hypothetical protein LB507_002638 [Fusarium sp. FIESC RH6]